MDFYLVSFRLRRGTRCLRRAVAVSLLLGLWWGECVYAGQKVIIITSSDSPAYHRAVAAFETQVKNDGLLASYTRHHWSLDKARAKGRTALIDGQVSVIVTVGSAAAAYAVGQRVDTPIICSFITRNAFDTITAEAPSKHLISAVFMDQPIKRLINLSVLLRKDQSPYKIGLLSQAVLAGQEWAREGLTLDHEIEINSVMLLLNKNPIKQIEPLMKTSDVFIVRPNTSLFNRLVAKLVLQLSIRYQTPVIGFSEKYARAGALLSLYASPANIGMDASRMINEWLLAPQQALPRPRVGGAFSIVINQRIARKQGMTLNPEQLLVELQRMEGE